MANTFFQFKQFTIHQERCAMKVSTEACILGAWVSDTKPNRILDIGTGTGLLALMLAQRMNAPIDAIELDADASVQAKQNAVDSPWKDRIEVINQNVFDWAEQVDQKYDLIVSNPPFFKNNLKSEVDEKNLAKHDTSNFNKEGLANVLKLLLSEIGEAYILYPEYEARQFKKEIEKIGMYCHQALIIRNQPKGPIFRVISIVSKDEIKKSTDELLIRCGNEYSPSLETLLKPYYLKL